MYKNLSNWHETTVNALMTVTNKLNFFKEKNNNSSTFLDKILFFNQLTRVTIIDFVLRGNLVIYYATV